jgi:hypothetical protein
LVLSFESAEWPTGMETERHPTLGASRILRSREIDPATMGGIVRQRRIVDDRHALDPATWRTAG